MPRSGSTLLFNILREILRTKFDDGVSSGWHRDLLSLARGRIFLLKMHQLPDFYRWRAQHSFYTYRDLRVAAVSEFRMFNNPITFESMQRATAGYKVARDNCDLIVKYETLVRDPRTAIGKIAAVLKIPVDAKIIEESVGALASPVEGTSYSKENLLHPNHRTNTGDDEWRDIIPSELQRRISGELGWWFAECGYPPA